MKRNSSTVAATAGIVLAVLAVGLMALQKIDPKQSRFAMALQRIESIGIITKYQPIEKIDESGCPVEVRIKLTYEKMYIEWIPLTEMYLDCGPIFTAQSFRDRTYEMENIATDSRLFSGDRFKVITDRVAILNWPDHFLEHSDQRYVSASPCNSHTGVQPLDAVMPSDSVVVSQKSGPAAVYDIWRYLADEPSVSTKCRQHIVNDAALVDQLVRELNIPIPDAVDPATECRTLRQAGCDTPS